MTDANGGTAEPARRKRGRPPGSAAEKRRRLLPKPEDSESDQQDSEIIGCTSSHQATGQSSQKLLQKYQETLKTYEKTVFNSHAHHILRRVAAEAVLQQKSQQEPVLQQVMDVAKKTLLSEVETVVWSLHLGRTNVNDVPMPLHSALLVSAFYVKLGLGAEVAPLRAFLEKQQGGFASNLDMWEKTYAKETVTFTLQEVNAKWKQLNRPISEEDVPVINYNYYVDDILQAGVTPVDSFTSSEPKGWWGSATPVSEVPEPQQLRPIKPVPTPLPAYEPVFAKECEDFQYAPIQWFEPVPVSPGLLFFNFPSPPVSALLQPMDENFDSRALPHIGQ